MLAALVLAPPGAEPVTGTRILISGQLASSRREFSGHPTPTPATSTPAPAPASSSLASP